MKSLVKLTPVLFLILATLSAYNQSGDLYYPQSLQQAYNDHTRSEDGKPGKNYSQNHADYRISVDFNPKTGMLKGSERIFYYNESNDSLDRLVVRLYMDLFKKGSERDFSIGSKDLHDGVDISNLKINGKKINVDGDRIRHQATTMFIQLEEALQPNGKVKLEMDWKVKMPMRVTIRMGRYGEDNWFVAYWYPQIAVYDDITGWDTQPFTGSAEFYNDFNEYDVTVNVPENYLVWATGSLQKEKRHFQSQINNRLKRARKSDSVIHVIKWEDIQNGNVLKDNAPWHYKASEVPDFAFAVSKSYLWDATSVEVNKKQRVSVDAVYKRDSKDFHKVAGISAKTIKLFSEEIMGVPFPYPSLTAFNGSGGMEFPMMINDGDSQDLKGTVHLTAHEIGHNYFPFYVMTNETYYAFMDEGLISFLPREVERHLIEDYDPFAGLIQSYAHQAASANQVPLMVKSYIISDYSAYRTHAYTRPANAFYFLRDMLGEELFSKALKEYITRWAKKHPTPYDFFNTIEDVSGKELDWYWKPWFFELGYPDLSIGEIKETKEGKELIIHRKGKFPVPIKLQVRFKNEQELNKDISAEIWKDGKTQHAITIPEGKEVDYILLGGMMVPDAFPEDNVLKMN